MSAFLPNWDKAQAKFPSDTMFNFYFLPTIKAAIELQSDNTLVSVQTLEAAEPYELSLYWNMYPAYTRGGAILKSKNPSAAIAEFRRILDHPGIAQHFVPAALARLQIGCA